MYLFSFRAVESQLSKKQANRLEGINVVKSNNCIECYTEDKVPVYNLFISNVPHNILVEDMQIYFRQFGEVSKIHLWPLNRTGYVNFMEPFAAAKALQQKDHRLSKTEEIHVTAAYSWHQPTKSTPIDNKWDRASTLLCLDDDCLVQICQHLKLPDHMYLALTHARFAAVIQMCFKHKYKQVNIEQLSKLTLWQKREFFRLFGSTIETFTSSIGRTKNANRIFLFISNYCKNLKSMQLRDGVLKDDDLLAITNLPNLQTFSLSHNEFIKGEFLQRLRTVQHLDLEKCSNIQCSFLIDALQSMKLLKSLNVINCYLYSDFVQAMTRSCSELEVLKMSLTVDVKYECVAQLPRLKHLELDSESFNPLAFTQILTALVENKSQQLEHLKLYCLYAIRPQHAVLLGAMTQLKHLTCAKSFGLGDNCLREFAKLKCLEELSITEWNEISNNGLLHLLEECTKLKKLDISKCRNITNEFVSQAIVVLERTATERNGPLVIDVSYTEISEPQLEGAVAASLLQLCVGCMDDEGSITR